MFARQEHTSQTLLAIVREQRLAFPTPNATRRVPEQWTRTTRSPDPVRGTTRPSIPPPPDWREETYPKAESPLGHLFFSFHDGGVGSVGAFMLVGDVGEECINSVEGLSVNHEEGVGEADVPEVLGVRVDPVRFVV